VKARVLEGAALAGTLALAALLRLGWPGVNLWDFDQALVSLLSLRMARQGMPSSTSLPNFPATIWIFALPYSISTDLLVASLFVGVLGMLAVLGVWWLARRAWGAVGGARRRAAIRGFAVRRRLFARYLESGTSAAARGAMGDDRPHWRHSAKGVGGRARRLSPVQPLTFGARPEPDWHSGCAGLIASLAGR
jgi:hypothetical protein